MADTRFLYLVPKNRKENDYYHSPNVVIAAANIIKKMISFWPKSHYSQCIYLSIVLLYNNQICFQANFLNNFQSFLNQWSRGWSNSMVQFLPTKLLQTTHAKLNLTEIWGRGQSSSLCAKIEKMPDKISRLATSFVGHFN